MSRNHSPSWHPTIVVVLCIGGLAACIDPQCPSGYSEMEGRCYRIKDGGTQTTEPVEGDDGSVDGAEAGTPDDASFGPGLEAGSPDVPDTSVPDTGAIDAATDAGPPPVDAGDQSDTAVTDAGATCASPPCGEEDAAPAQQDAGHVTCASQPCENGGTCTDEPSGFHCSCTAPYMGDRCERRICSTMFLRTQEDLDKARSCAEIQGDLTLPSAGIAAITDADLPYLTKITGNFSMSGLNNNGVEQPRLSTLTLAALREIGGALSVAQIGAGSATEIRLPALIRVGRGVAFANTETRRLELPALRTVEVLGFTLAGLKRLCALEIEAVEHISGGLNLADLLNLPASTLEPLRRAFGMTPTAENRIGCCVLLDSNCREGFSTADRQAFCGCSSP